MPSIRVHQTTLRLKVFDVLGEDGDQFGFIGHAGLAESSGSHDTSSVSVLDMGPPLRASKVIGQIEASVLGCAELTDDEVWKIKTFVQRHANEHLVFTQLSSTQILRASSEMYSILPHATPHAEADGRYSRTRFSCSGFVFEAYKKARIELLDACSLPAIDMSVISLAYRSQAEMIDRGMVDEEKLGLVGNGPWPVMLCGYLFHSLNRDSNTIREIPLVPTVDDRFFLDEEA